VGISATGLILGPGTGRLSYNRPMSSTPLRLICPRMCPQWEFAARLALVKPKPYTKEAIVHRHPRQPWSRSARRVIEALIAELPSDGRESMSVEFPSDGENRLVIDFAHVNPVRVNAIAKRISRQLPELWFSLGPVYLRNGEFFRRWGKYKLELIRTKHAKLRRAVRFGFYGDLDHAVASARHRERQNDQAQSNR